MPWGAAIGAGISLIGSQMSSDKNGGAGTTTTDKSPWIAAQPFISSQLTQGQNLASQYAAQPLSAQQQAAISNIYGQSDKMRSLVPSLLSQLQGQPVGYDPSNPGKQTAWDWSSIFGNGGGAGTMTGANTQPAAAPASAPASKFVNQVGVNGLGAPQTTGSYGSFTYGDNPTPGSKQWADMQKYLQYGGADPLGYLGGGNGAVFNPSAFNNRYLSGGMYGGPDGEGSVGSSSAPASGTGGLF